jgi:hypothetical protein
MQQRGATVALDSNSAQVFDQSIDITSAVQQQLDQSTRTATVARHSVSECQQAANQAAGH